MKKNMSQRKEHEDLLKLNVNDHTNITSTPHKEKFSNQNYEAIEDRETAL